MTKFSSEQIPDLTGHVALVTGGNTGIGETSVYELARHGAKVYLAARSQQRAEAALQRLQEKDAEAAKRVEWLPLDLSDLESVKKAAEKFQTQEEKLHILLNNAGVMGMPYEMTKQGLEIQNGTNVIGHAVLSLMLLPQIVRAARDPSSRSSARIVQVSSYGHQAFGSSKQSWADIDGINARQGREFIGTWRRYGQSKSGNILLSNELKKILAGERVANLSVHPGVIATELIRGPAASWGVPIGFMSRLSKLFMLTPQQGALTSLYACSSPDVDGKGLNGAYLVPIAQVGKAAAHVSGAEGDKHGAQLMAFVKRFAQEKIGVDLDQTIQQALAR